MAGRFPKLVTPGYADDSPLSFPIRLAGVEVLVLRDALRRVAGLPLSDS